MTKGVKSIAQGHTIATYEVDSPGLRTERVLAWSPKVRLCREYTCTRRKTYREHVGGAGPGSKQREQLCWREPGSVIEDDVDSGKQHVGVC